MASIKILGIMTGTSCDAIDMACVSFKNRKDWKVLWTWTGEYPQSLKKRVFAIQKKPHSKQNFKQSLLLHRDLGQWYAEAVKKAFPHNSLLWPDLIALHGQTVLHLPNEKLTVQLGDPFMVALQTQTTVLSQFRMGDLVGGGQGAPLVPLFHQEWVKDRAPRSKVIVHNIGGVSNISYVKSGQMIKAFDTGPGNAWIDCAIDTLTRGEQEYDQDGKMGRSGLAKTSFFEMDQIMAPLFELPYFRLKPPKSTGKDDFSDELFLKTVPWRDARLVTAVTYFSAKTIAEAYKKFMPPDVEKVVFCGGGAKNQFLLELIQELSPFKKADWLTSQDWGVDPQMVEPIAFAYLGFDSLFSHPLGGAWTGNKNWAPGAMILPSKNWSKIVQILPKLASF